VKRRSPHANAGGSQNSERDSLKRLRDDLETESTDSLVLLNNLEENPICSVTCDERLSLARIPSHIVRLPMRHLVQSSLCSHYFCARAIACLLNLRQTKQIFAAISENTWVGDRSRFGEYPDHFHGSDVVMAIDQKQVFSICKSL
jgi:hypothetical protein